MKVRRKDDLPPEALTPTRHPPLSALLTTSELALALGRSDTYVLALKRAGYVFQYADRTTVDHVLDWLAVHPEFRSTNYIRAPRSRQADPVPVQLAGGDTAVDPVNCR